MKSEWDIHIISLVRKSPNWGQSQGLLSVGVSPSPPQLSHYHSLCCLGPFPTSSCPERPQTCLQGPVRWMDALCDSVRVGRPGSGFPLWEGSWKMSDGRCAEEFPGPLLLPPEPRATFSGASGGVGKQICLPFLAAHHLPVFTRSFG